MIQGGDSTMGKIYVKDSIYRMDLNQQGHAFIVIVNQDSNITYLLMPPEKLYMDMPTDDQMSVRNDPFQGLKYTIANGEERFLTTERMNGQDCDKYAVLLDSNKVLEYWQHKRLDFPIKIAGTVAPRNTMELLNIEITALDDSIFQIPEEYDAYEPGMIMYPEPDWLPELDSIEIVDAPFRRDMSEGDIVRVPFGVSLILTVTADNLSSEKSAYVAIPLRNSKPVADYTQSICTVPSTKESFRFDRTNIDADEIVVWVQEGLIAVFVENR